MADPNLKVTVSADTSKADAALGKLQASGDKVAQSMGAQGTSAKNLGLQYTELNNKISLIQKGYDAVKNIVTPVVTQAKEQEAAIRNLTEALKAQNTYTEAGVAANQAFADSMSTQLAIDDDVITSIQAYIAGLTELSGDALNEATLATIQYAQVTGKSYESAQRVITAYLDGATPKVRGLALEVEKEASAHEKVNALLNETQAGYAQLTARTDEFEGKQAKLGVAWENLQEAMGGFITTSPIVREGMDFLANAAEGLTVILDGRLVEGIKTAISWLNAFTDPLDNLKLAVRLVGQVFEDTFRGIAFLVEATWNKVVDVTTAMSDEMVGHSIIPDMVDKSISEFDRMEAGASKAAKGMSNIMQDQFLHPELFQKNYIGGGQFSIRPKDPREYYGAAALVGSGGIRPSDDNALTPSRSGGGGGSPSGSVNNPVNVRVVSVAPNAQTGLQGYA